MVGWFRRLRPPPPPAGKDEVFEEILEVDAPSSLREDEELIALQKELKAKERVRERERRKAEIRHEMDQVDKDLATIRARKARRDSRRDSSSSQMRQADISFLQRPPAAESTAASGIGQFLLEDSRSSTPGKAYGVSSLREQKPKKSGMVAKSSDAVRYPQLWPHAALQDEYLFKCLSFSELDFRLLVAGELEIISSDNISSVERSGRLRLLKRLTYLHGVHGVECLKNIYTSIVRKIELGLLRWDSQFISEIQWLVTKQVASTGSSYSRGGQRGGLTDRKARDRVWYCQDFNQGKCTLKDPHKATVKGQTVQVGHFCARCWNRKKVRVEHAEKACSE